ncbi:hypothetical protein VTJ49DRAFT_1717 [Mycothermus thermophilus]|uniref:Nudix hydrolase domain-containing protein n=1 Tax=Humicola insolens TaxID=85995 RepID=A0ABR3VC16_HUMIN
MATQSPVVRVGVAALVRDAEGRLLMGVRQGQHGGGTWQFPGGHLEVGEATFGACAEREALEETGLAVRADRVVAVTNDMFGPEKHYVTVMEPEKCACWEWKTWNDVRNMAAAGQVFLPIANLLRDHPDIEALTDAAH